MTAIHSVPNTIITIADVQEAQRQANDLHDLCTAAWEQVELATRTALCLEAQAEKGRARVQRVKHQVGFRRVGVDS